MRLLRATLGLVGALSFGAVRVAVAQPAAPHGPPQMLHPAAGKQDCLSCHGRGANEHITSVPAGHSYGNGACGMCHKPIAAVPKAVGHALDDAHADCRKCHVQAADGVAPAPGAAPAPPASHATFHVSTCRLCHATAPTGVTAPQPGTTGGTDGAGAH
jgi:hypothetical protein